MQSNIQLPKPEAEKISADKAIEEFEKVKAQKDEEITKITEEGDETLSALQASQARISDLETRTDAQEKAWDDLNDKYKDLGATNEELQVLLANEKNEHVRAENDLNVAQDYYNNMRTEKMVCSADLNTEKAMTTRLRDMVKDLNEAKEREEKNTEQLETSIREAGDRLNSAETERDTAISEQRDIQKQKEECETKQKQLEDEMQQLKQEAKEAAARITSIEHERDSAASKQEDVQKMLKDEIRRLKQDGTEAAARLHYVENERDSAASKQKDENKRLEVEIQQLKQESKVVAVRLLSVENERDTARSEQEAMRNQKDDYETKQKHLGDEIQQLKDQARDSQAEYKQELNRLTMKIADLGGEVKEQSSRAETNLSMLTESKRDVKGLESLKTSLNQQITELARRADNSDQAVAAYFMGESGTPRRFLKPWNEFLKAFESHGVKVVGNDTRSELPWLVKQPVPNLDEDDRLYSLPSMETLPLIMQLYSNITTCDLSNKSFYLLESLTSKLAKDTELNDAIVALLIKSAVEVLIKLSTLESGLLSLGFFGLHTLVNSRWGLALLDDGIVDSLRGKLSQSPIISEIFTAMENNTLREFCRTSGLFYEQQAVGLVKTSALEYTVIYCDFNARTIQAVDRHRMECNFDTSRLIGMTPDQNDVIFPVDSEAEMRWWIF